MTKNNFVKRIISAVLCLLVICGTVPAFTPTAKAAVGSKTFTMYLSKNNKGKYTKTLVKLTLIPSKGYSDGREGSILCTDYGYEDPNGMGLHHPENYEYHYVFNGKKQKLNIGNGEGHYSIYGNIIKITFKGYHSGEEFSLWGNRLKGKIHWETSDKSFENIYKLDTMTWYGSREDPKEEKNGVKANVFFKIPGVTVEEKPSIIDKIKNGFSSLTKLSGSVTMQVEVAPKTSPNVATITIPKNAEVPITKVSGNKGYATYNGYSGWINLNYCQYVGPVITKPAAPSLTLATSKDIDINGSITVNWASVTDAKYYTVGLYNSSGQVVKSYSDIYGNSASFCVSEPGTYSVRATAHNNLYASEQTTLAQLITVHGDSTVTFLNDDGSVIGTQKVGYGGSATAPLAPYKKGYSFQGWSGSLSNIKADTTVTATYTANEYKVQFIDYNGDVIGSTQTVKYGEDAVAPDASTVPVKSGYEFVGWDSELYKDVYADSTSAVISINAIYSWINRDLPITCNVVSAQRQTDSYKIVFDVTNNIDEHVRGRAIVCLKTAGGKLIDTTESAAFSLAAGETLDSYRVFVPSSKAATTAEIIIVDGYSTGIPIAEKTVITDIDQAKMWSDWSEEYPEGHEDDLIESRVEYRYRDISRRYANTKSIGSDWVLEKTTPTVSGWSAWSDNRVTEFNYDDKSRKVETRTVDVYSSRTLYNYFHYYNPSTGRWSPVQYSGFTQHHTKQTTSQLAYKGTSSVSGWYYYGSDNCSTCGAQNMWYPNGTSTQSYVSGSKTQYRYQDTTYTYTFTKWDDAKWKEWSTNSVSEIPGERQVEDRIVYRYKSANAGVEDDSGVSVDYPPFYVGIEYAGKNVTIFITKYDATSDFTNEFVAQTVVADDGYCSFTYKLREEPTEKTGDFTISIGIESQTGLVQVGTIEAPDPVYTVKYYDADGQVISEQKVTEGENAVIPTENPEKPGSIFAGWNNTGSNVRSDLDIKPIFVEEVYTVTYIDWRAETYETMEYRYGEPLITPTIEDCESGTAIGWDTESVTEDENGNKIVTCDMVLTALYETRAYKVVYYDAYGNVINEQEVEYDGAVVEPELPEDEDVSYIEWEYDEEELLSVKHDIAVFPSYIFNETTVEPVASLKTGAYTGSQTVELTCEDESAVIYYTLDGSDPQENPDVLIYEEPFTIDETTTLIYYASSLGKNDSNYACNHYVIDSEGTIVNVIDQSDENRNTTFIVKDFATYDDSEFDCIDGYTYKGLYYDANYLSKADLKKDTMGEVVNLYVKYTAKTYMVTFYDRFGDIVSVETTTYGSSVTPPEMENDGSLVFTGWDSDAYELVYDNLEINPIYKEESGIVGIFLDKTIYSIDEGAMFKLNATVASNSAVTPEILWYSDNYNIAEIGDDGIVVGVNPGQTTVYATTEDGEAYAECVVTVGESPNMSICLKELSVLGVDSMGFLRELKVDNNTVSLVKTQLRNAENELEFTDINGIVLSNEELAGTGTVISLVKDSKTIDTMTIAMTGDVNGDGLINNRDVVITAQFILEILESVEQCQLVAMDANGDGKVNTRDASVLSRYLVGKAEI